MDLFILDKLIIGLVKKFMSNTALQFGTLVGLWILLEIALPTKKEQKK